MNGSHSIIERGIMPDGTKVQREDWSAVYDCFAFCSTIAAYPIAKESGDGCFSPKRGETFRIAIDFECEKDAIACFQSLVNGSKQIKDYAEHCRPRDYVQYL